MAVTYISGPIHNLSDEIKALFEKAENDLTEIGHTPVNPLKIHKDGLISLPLRLETLSRCDAIYMLPGWLESGEARAEKLFAELTEKEIMFQSREETDRFESIKIASQVNKVAGAIQEVTGMSLKDYATGTREVQRYYCRLLFIVHCMRSGVPPQQIVGTYIDRSSNSVLRAVRKYDDEICNPRFRALADKVNQLLYPETYHTDTIKA